MQASLSAPPTSWGLSHRPPATRSHLKVANVFENKGVIDVDLLADFVVHGVHVCLVHGHTLLGQRRCVVYWDIMEFRVVLPVLVWRDVMRQIPFCYVE